MAVNPRLVISPKTRLDGLRVLHQAKGWSLAIGLWDGNRALLTRWNGDAQHLLGNPVSRARPTWFVLPEDFHGAILGLIPQPNRTSGAASLEGGEPSDWAD